MAESSLFVERSSTLNVINGVGNALRKVGLNPFRLDADKAIHTARKRSGIELSLPGTEKGLKKLMDSVRHEARLNPFGSLAVKRLVERNLYQRFMIENYLSHNPDSLTRPIESPVFIIGMPRTGTTILHALLHSDPAMRSPLCWECLLPYPLLENGRHDNNPQLDTIRKEFGQLFKLVPDLLQKHYMAADSPQECLGITALDFNSLQFMAQMYLPSYMDWFYNESDQLSTLRWHKRFLQYLQQSGPQPERWLLKSPVHLMRLQELFEVYPDARIIMTHRHPNKSVPSTASLLASVRSLYSDHEDPVRTGAEQLDLWSKSFNDFLRVRQEFNKEDQFIDIRFSDFAADQMSVVRKIYDKFNWQLTPTAEQNMNAFLKSNPKDKHGKHNYTLEDFGLTNEQIETRFAKYLNFLRDHRLE